MPHTILVPNISIYNITSLEKKLENQDICLKYYPTENMIADVQTKPLAKDRHQTSTNAMDLKTFDLL